MKKIALVVALLLMFVLCFCSTGTACPPLTASAAFVSNQVLLPQVQVQAAVVQQPVVVQQPIVAAAVATPFVGYSAGFVGFNRVGFVGGFGGRVVAPFGGRAFVRVGPHGAVARVRR